MMRVLNSATTRKRHRKIMKRASGFVGSRSTHFRIAKEAVNTALEHSTVDRRRKRRDMRRLWIKRISNNLAGQSLSYSKMIPKLSETGLNRCMLAYLAASHPQVLQQLISKGEN